MSEDILRGGFRHLREFAAAGDRVRRLREKRPESRPPRNREARMRGLRRAALSFSALAMLAAASLPADALGAQLGLEQAFAGNAQPARAAASGPGRVFALIVGVSDYGGRTNDLANTDADAKTLALQLERAGAFDQASVLLTNQDATRAAVEQAFERIANEAGPDDTFLFFFSGHGQRVKMPGPLEPDGRSETIELHDRAMTDSELARMFGTLRTRLAIVALDSCFSGGFDNVLARPNVMGLFSSEEHLTSNVADEHDAGGYLAYFLQQALGGAADGDGDLALTAGELGAFLERSFAEQGKIPARTEDGEEGLQRLVVARGGVRPGEILYRLAPPTTELAEYRPAKAVGIEN
jgi:hypothetical protein